MKKLILFLTALFSGSSLSIAEEKEGIIKIDIQWGGYYVSKEKDKEEYSLLRLLDFNQQAYHAAIYQEKFSEIPLIEDILKLSPMIGHAPIDSKALAGKKEIHLVGSKELVSSDLEGYEYYLEHFEVEEKERKQLISDIIGFSKEPPLKLSLQVIGDELIIKERE